MTEWKTYTIAEIAAPGKHSLSTGPFGSAISSRYFQTCGTPVIRGANLSLDVSHRLIDDGLVFLDNEKAAEFQRSIARCGDLVFTCWGTIGQVGLVDKRSRFAQYIVSNKQMKLTPHSQLADPLFLYYALSSPAAVAMIQGASIGSSVPGFNLTQLRSLKVSLPGLREQQAIAAVLGSLDDKIAVNERIAETSLALGDSLHEILQRTSEGAATSTIGELTAGEHLQLGDGYRTKRSEYGTPGLPILRVAEVGDGEITPAFGDNVREEFRPAMGGKVSASGDVVLTTKGTVGRVAMISPAHPEFVYSPQVCYFRVTAGSAVSRFYLFHWFRSKEFWRQANGMKRQTDMADYLSLRDVKSLRMAIPPRELMAEFDKKYTALYARLESARSENRTLADLRNTLLPQLVTGKIRIKDAARVVEDVAS
ncbi:hypothetical protein HEP86_22710 [Streptomyces sp. RPA4-5]|uniref:restriction endonuclease subunit S n=1 Tax=Streptomyces sp. RPA4-5 TaxID=2721245 RepID=UPI00143EB21D|nr:restriction endonuclease subunit S [Streptomyces sp. RPA4-5]QIY56823.1 hypothetical protein HEP86_22710 [Streptomyces sp. RPA4-5]